MAYPVEVFPASELPSRLLSHTTVTTKTTAVGTTVKRRKEPITADYLRNECELLRTFQYQCQIVEGAGYNARRMSKEEGIKKLQGGGGGDTVHVRCFPVERLVWRCGENNLIIDGTASELAHRQAAETSNR